MTEPNRQADSAEQRNLNSQPPRSDSASATQSSSLARRRPIGLYLLVAIALTAGTSWLAYQSYIRIPKRFATVREAVLYRSAQPKPPQLKTLVNDYGLKTLFIVRDIGGDSVQREIEEARRLGINVIEAPIESRQPVPEDRIREFFACIDDPANHPVLIHCSAGRHRTGVLCAAYRIERDGWSNARAVDELHSFGFDVGSHRPLLEQVEAYRPHYPTTAATAQTQPKD